MVWLVTQGCINVLPRLVKLPFRDFGLSTADQSKEAFAVQCDGAAIFCGRLFSISLLFEEIAFLNERLDEIWARGKGALNRLLCLRKLTLALQYLAADDEGRGKFRLDCQSLINLRLGFVRVS